MGTLLRHGSDEQKQRYLPKIASRRAAAAGVRRDRADGRHRTRRRSDHGRARRRGLRVNGQKIWTSRALHSDLMLLLARTTPEEVRARRPTGCRRSSSTCARRRRTALTIQPIKTMMNHDTTEVFFDDMFVPADALVGEEGKGFRYILDGMNAERILIAAECIGDGRWFIERAAGYASRAQRVRPADRENQGIAVPARAAHARIEAADLMRYKAARLFDAGAVRSRGEHGQAAGRRGVMVGGQRLPGHPRRVRLRARSTTSSASSERPGCTRSRRSRTT